MNSTSSLLEKVIIRTERGVTDYQPNVGMNLNLQYDEDFISVVYESSETRSLISRARFKREEVLFIKEIW